MAAGDVDVQLINPASESCASFDGVDDVISLTKTFGVTTAGTICCFVKWAPNVGANNTRPMGKASNFAFEIVDTAGGTQGRVDILNAGLSDTYLVGVTKISQNTWAHIAGVYDGTNMRIYVNGVLSASEAATGSLTDGSNEFFVSGEIVSREMNGFVRDVRMYNRGLSAAEVLRVSNGEAITEGLVVWWKLNDASGSATASDSSGNGNDGTVTGAVFIKDSGSVDTAITTQRTTTGATGTFLLADTMNGTALLSTAITQA